MKLNRFGMNQRIFLEMSLLWLSKAMDDIKEAIENRNYLLARQLVSNTKAMIDKTFIEGNPTINFMRSALDITDESITQALADLA